MSIARAQTPGFYAEVANQHPVMRNCTERGFGTANLGYRTQSQTLVSPASSSKAVFSLASPPGRGQFSSRSALRVHAKGLTSTNNGRQVSQKFEAATFQASAVTADSRKLRPDQLTGTFENLVSESENAVLVDFYAPWCGPCELMSRAVSKLSLELKEVLTVVTVNTDNYPKLASKYRVQALPTCLLFRDGKLIDRVNGFMPESSFDKRVRFYVARLDKKFGKR